MRSRATRVYNGSFFECVLSVFAEPSFVFRLYKYYKVGDDVFSAHRHSATTRPQSSEDRWLAVVPRAMAFANNYYNYQVGVIFAILLGALILLALFVLAMYFVVKSMRQSPKPTYTPSRSISSTRPTWQAQVEPAPIQYSNLENAPTSPIQSQYPQPSPMIQQGYQQQPLVQSYPSEPVVTYPGQVRSLQPEMTYQQGPTSWSIVTPVHEAPHRLEVPAHQAFPTSSV
uniref:CX domain-containing protein n=1 Tax=Steinernema glaseri TaxID=37863 RepID=A0A1I7YD33_9BILA